MTLEAGVPAPFEGHLMARSRALRLGLKVERCEFLLDDQALRLKGLHEIDLKLDRTKLEIQVEKGKAREAVLEAAAFPPWYERVLEHPVFVATVTALATYGILKLANELNPAR